MVNCLGTSIFSIKSCRTTLSMGWPYIWDPRSSSIQDWKMELFLWSISGFSVEEESSESMEFIRIPVWCQGQTVSRLLTMNVTVTGATLHCLAWVSRQCLGKQESEIFNPTHKSLNSVLRLMFFKKLWLLLATSLLHTFVLLILLWFYSQLLTGQVNFLLWMFSF